MSKNKYSYIKLGSKQKKQITDVLEDSLLGKNQLLCYRMSIKDITKNRYFIIKYGPPASGKSRIEESIKNRLKITRYIDVNVDQYILYLNSGKIPNQEKYWKLRDPGNALSDIVLYRALENSENIMWETTGNTINWSLDVTIPIVRAYGYKVVIVYPVAELETLVLRCKARAQAADCDKINLIKQNSDNNFKKLATKCDYVYIYDNNGNVIPKLLYETPGASDEMEAEDKLCSQTKILTEPLEKFYAESCSKIQTKKKSVK
jgi:predicted ABC-type ATPase